MREVKERGRERWREGEMESVREVREKGRVSEVKERKEDVREREERGKEGGRYGGKGRWRV